MSKATPGKRERLVTSAMRLFHQQGLRRTSIADVAQDAGVPVGNVYYYFKTKDALRDAVIDRFMERQRLLEEGFADEARPQRRLARFIQRTIDERNVLAAFGCPLGGLCSEVCKSDPDKATASGRVFAAMLTWLQDQFQALGCGRASRGHAVHLLSALEGVSLLAGTFSDAGLVEREGKRLQAWVKTVGKVAP